MVPISSPPLWFIVLIFGVVVMGGGTLVSVTIAKENRFHQSYAQARSEIVEAVGSQEDAGVALALFDRTDKCQRRGKQRISPSSSGFTWAMAPFAEIETIGRQVAQECFLAQVNTLEATRDSDLMAKLRAAVR